jgi:hypothetical protein
MSLTPEIQTKYKEIPINRYNIVHTGPNTQLGGLKLGFISVAYHEDTDEAVNKEPRIPTNSQITIEAISLRKSIFIREGISRSLN